MAIEDLVEEKIVPSPSTAADLSKEIEQSAKRESDESIKAVRVFGNYYRCNWRVLNKSPNAFWLATGTIRKSRLLRATLTKDGLKIEDVTLTGKQG